MSDKINALANSGGLVDAVFCSSASGSPVIYTVQGSTATPTITVDPYEFGNHYRSGCA